MISKVMFGANYVFTPGKDKKLFTSAPQAVQFAEDMLTNDRFNQYGGEALAVDAADGKVYLKTTSASDKEGLNIADTRVINLVASNLEKLEKDQKEAQSQSSHSASSQPKSSVKSPIHAELNLEILNLLRHGKGFNYIY